MERSETETFSRLFSSPIRLKDPVNAYLLLVTSCHVSSNEPLICFFTSHSNEINCQEIVARRLHLPKDTWLKEEAESEWCPFQPWESWENVKNNKQSNILFGCSSFCCTSLNQLKSFELLWCSHLCCLFWHERTHLASGCCGGWMKTWDTDGHWRNDTNQTSAIRTSFSCCFTAAPHQRLFTCRHVNNVH